MKQDRFHPVIPPEFYACKHLSFYHFIEQYCPDNSEQRPLHRIFSLMRKMNAKTLVLEDLAKKGELNQEVEAVELRCGKKVEFKAWRFSFFASPVTEELLPYVDGSTYLGYAVFVCLRLPNGKYSRYIYESTISEPKFYTNDNKLFETDEISLLNNYIHCARNYIGWIAGKRFTVQGSFFSQQNNLTNVCAHANLRWILNNSLPEREEEIVSYENINKCLNIDHKSRKVGSYGNDMQSIGLPYDDVTKAIKTYGYNYIDVSYENSSGPTQPYWEFIYSIIESGYPVMVCFKTSGQRHVVGVVGHTLNTDTWSKEPRLAYSGAPHAQYLSASSWVDHFIIHDDNYGMYFCMPSETFSYSENKQGQLQVTDVLGIVPTDEIKIYPSEAELFSSITLQAIINAIPLKECYWLKAVRKEEKAFSKWIVCRTFLTSKIAYKNHLYDVRDGENNVLEKDRIQKIIGREKISEYFWVTEISLTDLYTANKHKLGEVLFDASKKPDFEKEDSNFTYLKKIFANCFAIRLPGNVIIPGATKVMVYKTNLIGHVPLFRTCRKTPKMEW